MSSCELIRLRYSDQYAAFARLWMPAAPRGAVLYLHGIQSHGHWFEMSAERLAEAGFAVLLPDRRGSGRNEVERGHAASPRRLLEDVNESLDELHIRTGMSRFHMVGVSWGGKLALAAARRVPQRVGSVTLVAPGLFASVDLPLAVKMRVGWSMLASRTARFPIPLDDPALFTANPDRQAFIRDDPLKLTEVTASFLIASRRLDRYALGLATSPSGPPLTVFLAGRDRIIDNRRTQAFVRKLRWRPREIVVYPEAEHTLEFEAEPSVYLNDLVRVLETRIRGGEVRSEK